MSCGAVSLATFPLNYPQDDFRLRYRICAHEAVQRDLAPPRFVPAESRNTFRILLHILRHAYQPVFHGESPDYAITLVQDFLARAEADAIARPNAAVEYSQFSLSGRPDPLSFL